MDGENTTAKKLVLSLKIEDADVQDFALISSHFYRLVNSSKLEEIEILHVKKGNGCISGQMLAFFGPGVKFASDYLLGKVIDRTIGYLRKRLKKVQKQDKRHQMKLSLFVGDKRMDI